ncbi:MAG: glycosyltransferase family 9 protein [Alphaproteobacteria bacterium]|nr:glycosyltransferase family 9 protein [Alphaproteobacteria bacterium]
MAAPRVLYIASNRIGDGILSTGVLQRMAETMPDARFTVACGPLCVSLFEKAPRIDAVISLKKQRYNMHWVKLWRLCAATHWDLIVDLRNSIVTRLLRARRKAYRAGGGEEHKVVQNAAVAGFDPPPSPHIWLTTDDRLRAHHMMPPHAATVALGPAANWAAKQWPAEKFAELVARLRAPGGLFPDAHVLILAAASEREQIKTVCEAVPDDRRIELIGGELRVAAACLQACKLFIGNDSGLMHLAAAIGTPTLGLFGPGYEKMYGPWGKHTAVVRTPESAAELWARLPYPGASEPNLMNSLAVETVEQATKHLLLKIRQ